MEGLFSGWFWFWMLLFVPAFIYAKWRWQHHFWRRFAVVFAIGLVVVFMAAVIWTYIGS